MGALKSPKCSRGHAMKDPNLYYRSDGNRECRRCKTERMRELRKRRAILKMSQLPKKRKERKKNLKQLIILKGKELKKEGKSDDLNQSL